MEPDSDNLVEKRNLTEIMKNVEEIQCKTLKKPFGLTLNQRILIH